MLTVTSNYSYSDSREYPWYNLREDIKSVVIGNGVTSIGSYAFWGCSSLTSINIPDGVTSIGYDAFYYCTGLTSINIPSSVTSIGYDAFYYCTGLTSINIPDGVTSIGYYAFYGCSGLTSITIPDGVTSIGDWAFNGCSGLTSINIPDGVTSIGYDAFDGCSSLSYNEYDNALYLGNAENPYLCLVRAKDTNITSCSINSNAKVICEGAFSGCSGLTSITIPESVTNIGEQAFVSCSGLTSITIPESVTNIGYRAFAGCSSLTSITIPDGVTSIGREAFRHCSNLISVTIGEGVTSIGRDAFGYCSNLISVTIGDGASYIEDCAFDGCSMLSFNEYDNALYLGNAENPYLCLVRAKDTNITSCSINSNAKVICGGAFSDCSGLTSITIPAGVTSIGNWVLSGCSSLTSINISENSKLTSIGEWAFNGCKGVTRVDYGGTIADWLKIEFGNGGNPLEYAHHLYIDGNEVKDVVIPDGVTSIGDYAFYYCSGLTSITIPDGVTSIGDYAFYRTGLTSITIPESVTSIGERAFYGCSGLTSINISENSKLTSIGERAFQDCNGLTCINIPESVTSIGNYAFGYCSGLTSINIPDGVTCIGTSAFYKCSGLTSITIPSSVTSIGNNAFYGCSKLKQVVTENANVSMIKSALGTDKTYIVPCTLYEQYVAAGLTTTAQHDLVRTEAVAATCTTDGNVEGYTCKGCGKHFADEEMTTEIAENSWVIAAIGHEWGSWTTTKAATCVAKGKKQRVCAHDASHVDVADIAINSNNHTNVVTDEAVAATCTETGLTEGSHCEACHAIVVAQATTDAIGHEWGSWSTTKAATCVAKGKKQRVCAHDASHVDVADIAINSNNHTNVVTDEAVAATCTETGLAEGSHCEACHVTLVAQETIAVIGHEWGSWKTTKKATCVAKGKKQRVCAHDASHVDVADIAINSSNHTNVVTDNAVAATCTETGLTEGSHCEACHVTLVAQETIAAIGHEWGSWTTTKAATCVAKGKKQRVCAHDASHVDVADIAINSNNHTNIVTDNAVAATCTTTGLTEGSHCEACHATLVAQETTEAIGHLFTDYIYNNDATTSADGTETAECDHNCGATDTHTAEGTKIIPTGVRQVSGNGQKVIKTIEDGKVVIIRDGVRYDITGRVLSDK